MMRDPGVHILVCVFANPTVHMAKTLYNDTLIVTVWEELSECIEASLCGSWFPHCVVPTTQETEP